MRSFHFTVGSRTLSKGFLIYGFIACASTLLFVSIANAQSNRSFATLHIQVTVAPTVQSSATSSPAMPESGNVDYDLKAKDNPTLTQQTTTRPMRSSLRPDSRRTSGTSNGAGAPAVLETLTIVAQ